MRRLLVLLAAPVVMVPAVAVAGWSSTAAGNAPVPALSMTNATGFGATCPVKSSTITLSWTPTTDEDVTHYVITRTATGGGTGRSFTVSPRTSSSTTDTVTTPAGGTVHTYSYRIQAAASAHPWTSPALAAPTSITVKNNGCA